MNEEEFNKFKDQVLKNLELHQQLLNKYKLLQEQNKTTEERIRETVLSFASSTTWCYGVQKIVKETNSFLRFLWIIASIASTIVCFYFIWKSISNYYAFETVTENYVKYENSLELPQITICGEGPEYLPLYLDFCTFDRYHDCLQNYQTVDILHRDGSISKCMQFNGGKNLVGHGVNIINQRGNEIVFGIKIRIKTNRSTSYEVLAENNYCKIYINNVSEKEIFDNPSLQLGFATSAYIRLEKRVENKLGKPYSDCFMISDLIYWKSFELIRRTIEFNSIYKKNKCYFLCFVQFMSQKFNCSFSGLYQNELFTRNCTDLNIDLDEEENKFDYEPKCSLYCPIECNSEIFSYYTNYVMDLDHGHLDQNSSKFLELIFFYDTLKVSYSIEIPKTTLPDLVSKVGGTFGLFIGLRLLSFVEIFGFILKISFLTYRKIKFFWEVFDSYFHGIGLRA